MFNSTFLNRTRRRLRTLGIAGFAMLAGLHSLRAHDESSSNAPPVQPASASRPLPPELAARLAELRKNVIAGEPMDEALGGRTMHGTPITPRVPECFPAESRDIFWQMDMVADGNGPLRPLNFDTNNDGRIDDAERNAIRGRNTWILWAGGNEGFWNWLAQDGYGISDFLVLLDSRARGSRFKRAGLINQPHYEYDPEPAKRILGLYLDTRVPGKVVDHDSNEPYQSYTNRLERAPFDRNYAAGGNYATGGNYPAPPNHGDIDLFVPGDPVLYSNTVAQLEQSGDGVSYSVYGYPSGIVGMRLFLNPDFFGVGAEPARARAYWKKRVEVTNGRYYSDASIQKDPKLVRPFRVGVSCGFCHVGPHPLNPPKDFEKPDWQNLSSSIGNQYWKPQPAFANLLERNSFLFHFLASQQPGTVDTSLVSSDHINNANTINAVYEVNARLARAGLNPRERQSADNVRVPLDYRKSIEDPGLVPNGDNQDLRHTPRVLVDGSDSIGAFGALARVYLNIGTYYEEWLRCHNAIIGFKKQRPFQLRVCQANSVYWQVNEQYRTEYLARYFTLKYAPPPERTNAPAAGTNFPNREAIQPSKTVHNSTQAMKLASVKDSDGVNPSKAAAEFLALDDDKQRIRGREIWLRHCAICHSSKQPDGFSLTFERKSGTWDTQAAPTNGGPYVLPMDAVDWMPFKRSPAYQAYTNSLFGLVQNSGRNLQGDPLTDEHPFWKENFLSTDIRVPVTLVGTSPARALASNALLDEVWDNFSSLTYKELPAVGRIGYFNPVKADAASFLAPGGGRGYYRPATHASLWATAPYLHNNAMGLYLDDPSTPGRILQFADGIRRVLNAETRSSKSLVLSTNERGWLANHAVKDLPAVVRRPGDLRGLSKSAEKDPGFIYRVPQDTTVEFAPGFIRPLIAGVAGELLTAILELWLWVLLFIWLVYLAWKRVPRYLGITLVGLAVLIATGIALTGVVGRGTTVGALLMALSGLLQFGYLHWILIASAFLLAGILFIQTRPESTRTANQLLNVVLIGIVAAIFLATRSVWITCVAALVAFLIGIRVRPTLAGFSRGAFVTLAVVTLLVGYAANCFINGRSLVTVPLANVKIGPFPASVGPIPRGTPVNMVMSLDPESPNTPRAVVSMIFAMAEIKKRKLVGDEAWEVFKDKAGQALLDASKCPDFVLDNGHLFGETLDPDPNKNREDKEALIAFLKTL